MPSPRKVDLLPEELREWLEEALRKSGFGNYVAIAEELNWKLEEAGLELRIQKSALQEFGVQYAEFVKVQKAADAWAKEWMTEQGIGDEAKRHNILFQMITALAFKVMQAQMAKTGEEIDPKELHFLGRMMKDIMHSSGIREQLMDAEQKRLDAKLVLATENGEITEDFRVKARQILGFA